MGILKRIARRVLRDDRPARPITSVQVELTNHCNYSCRFCPQSHRGKAAPGLAPYDRERGFMDFDLFRSIVDQAASCAQELNFSFFGEQTLHPRFAEFFGYLKRRPEDLRVVMNTNLSLVTSEIFSLFIDIGLDDLRLSIDAATSRTYDVVRPGGGVLNLDGAPATGDRFETICTKARHWFALPDHVPTRHVFPVNSVNREEMQAFAERWLPLLGPRDMILFKNVLTYGGKVRDTMIQQCPCNVWEERMLTVAWDGRVTPCNLDTNMDLAIGSIRDAGLLELFRGPAYAAARQHSLDRDAPPCASCLDSNNWSRNIVLRQGDRWREEIGLVFAQPPCPEPQAPKECPC